nr:adaptive-response sensory-kinase SasA [uncultured bacterium]
MAKAEEGATKLASNNAFLQEELNKRNRLDKALAQKRQELESSKNVLEIHVQARAQELQKLQRRYELILNSAGEGICGLDGDGKAAFVNPAVARITGWPIEDLIGKTEAQIFGANGVNGHSDGKSASEQLFHRKDGTSFPVELVKTAINEDGKQVGSVLIFKDITERKRAEETLSQKAAELARSNAELEQFAFVASHDLQEPLRKIQAFGDRVKTKCEGHHSSEVRDYLARMQSAAARMQTLINDLLAFSRVIRSSQPFVAVDLAAITKEVLGDLEVRIEQTHAKVELGQLPTVDADPLQMRQLMLNLIGNGLKFQPPGGSPVIKIEGRTITAASGEPFGEVTIQDNGIGFDEKYLEKIFAVFQRLHGRAEYEGTGVGLAVCRRITDRHGGTITAKSKPGHGATFVFTLPAHQQKPEKTEKSEKAEKAEKAENK